MNAAWNGGQGKRATIVSLSLYDTRLRIAGAGASVIDACSAGRSAGEREIEAERNPLRISL